MAREAAGSGSSPPRWTPPATSSATSDKEWGAQDFYSMLVTLKSFYIELGRLFRPRRRQTAQPPIVEESTIHKMPPDRSSYIENVLSKEFPDHPPFNRFDAVPLASGMVAQVHRAVLRDGQEIALKIQHQGVQEMMTNQLNQLQEFSDMLHRCDFDIGFDHQPIIREYMTQIPREFDFKMELDMIDKIKESLVRYQQTDESLERVHIPDTHRPFSTSVVLAMEYISGVPILDIKELEEPVRDSLMRSCIKFFGNMILLDGRFPCDPHSGNLLARCKDGEPQVVLLDFGQVKEISRQARIACARIVLALSEKDDDRIREEMHLAGISIEGCSRSFQSVAGFILLDTGMNIMRTFHRCGLDLKRTDQYRGARVSKLPMHLYLVVRVVTLLRGILSALDLNISSAKVWRSAAKHVLKTEGIPLPPSKRRRSPSTAPESSSRSTIAIDRNGNQTVSGAPQPKPTPLSDWHSEPVHSRDVRTVRTQPVSSNSSSFEFPQTTESNRGPSTTHRSRSGIDPVDQFTEEPPTVLEKISTPLSDYYSDISTVSGESDAESSQAAHDGQFDERWRMRDSAQSISSAATRLARQASTPTYNAPLPPQTIPQDVKPPLPPNQSFQRTASVFDSYQYQAPLARSYSDTSALFSMYNVRPPPPLSAQATYNRSPLGAAMAYAPAPGFQNFPLGYGSWKSPLQDSTRTSSSTLALPQSTLTASLERNLAENPLYNSDLHSSVKLNRPLVKSASVDVGSPMSRMSIDRRQRSKTTERQMSV